MHIDIHCHMVPESCMGIEAVGEDGHTYGITTVRNSEGKLCTVVDTVMNCNCDPEQLWDVDRRLRDMDRSGVDIQVISPAPFLYLYALEANQGLAFAQRINNEIAKVAASRPDRFRAMATVPLQAVDLAVPELERAVKELGIQGVEIGSNVRGKNLDESEFLPFFETVQQLDIPIFIHPSQVAARDRLRRYYLQNLIGNPLDTGIAVASLIFGGVLEKYPRLKIICAHAGGVVPYIVGRWDHGYRVRPEGKGIPKIPSEYWQQFYFDTIAHAPEALQFLVRRVGGARVLLGTDYPFDMGDEHPVETIRGLSEVSDADKSCMLGQTAQELFKIKASA